MNRNGTVTVPAHPSEAQSDGGHDWLVAEAMRGDNAAFSDLCQRYSTHLLRTIYRITRNQEDAEDALQDTLMRAFIHLQSFDHRAQFSTWLTKIAINSALMVLRKRKRRIELSIDSSHEEEDRFSIFELAAVADDPERCLLKNEKDARMRRGIEELDDKLRVALEAWIAQGSSTKQGARALHITTAAFKARVTRAKATLRSELVSARPRGRRARPRSQKARATSKPSAAVTEENGPQLPATRTAAIGE